MPGFREPSHHAFDPFGRLALAINDFRITAPALPLQIDRGEPQVANRRFQEARRLGTGQSASPHILEKGGQFCIGHGGRSNGLDVKAPGNFNNSAGVLIFYEVAARYSRYRKNDRNFRRCAASAFGGVWGRRRWLFGGGHRHGSRDAIAGQSTLDRRGGANAPAGVEPPPEIWWKNHKIVIPIQLKPEKQNEVRELLLFVSTDDGRTWNQEARVTPDKRSFQFLAPQDGRYWFTVCDVDFAGRKTPSDMNQIPPGLIVNVDTKPPVVKFQSTDRVGDDITVVWHIEEENPDPSTLKLEYRPAGDEAALWSAVPITPGPDGQGRFRATTPGAVMVRLSFQDRAANKSQTMSVIGANTVAAAGAFGVGAPAPTPPAPTPPVLPPVTAVGSTGPVVPVNLDPPAAAPPALPRVEPAAPDRPAGPPASTLTPIASSMPTAALPPRDSFTAARDAVPPPAANNNPASTRMSMSSPQLVNSTQITLGYKITSEGPSGVRHAILYVTDNDGQAWQEIGKDETGLGKVTAILPGEGIFGFRIVFESNAGLSKGPPQPGDQPEIRVEVDLTPPHVELYAPAPDPDHRDSLMLRWTATDKNLSTNTIDLEYAEKEDGPWTTIASPPNTGTYRWRLPRTMPVRVYLRVKARDLAGNIAEARTPQPQLIDLHKPEGILTNITGTTMPSR